MTKISMSSAGHPLLCRQRSAGCRHGLLLQLQHAVGKLVGAMWQSLRQNESLAATLRRRRQHACPEAMGREGGEAYLRLLRSTFATANSAAHALCLSHEFCGVQLAMTQLQQMRLRLGQGDMETLAARP